MHEVELSLEIAASTDRVWDVLTSFREYDEWNPIITRMRATLSAPSPVSFVIAVGGRELKIKAEMMTVQHGRELRWRGPPQWLLARAIHGEHYLRVEPVGVGRSRLIHGEQFGGPLLLFIWGKLKKDLEKAYTEMNRAVKARAESSWAGPPSSAKA